VAEAPLGKNPPARSDTLQNAGQKNARAEARALVRGLIEIFEIRTGR
jgi:hypothetical protein